MSLLFLHGTIACHRSPHNNHQNEWDTVYIIDENAALLMTFKNKLDCRTLKTPAWYRMNSIEIYICYWIVFNHSSVIKQIQISDGEVSIFFQKAISSVTHLHLFFFSLKVMWRIYECRVYTVGLVCKIILKPCFTLSSKYICE